MTWWIHTHIMHVHVLLYVMQKLILVSNIIYKCYHTSHINMSHNVLLYEVMVTIVQETGSSIWVYTHMYMYGCYVTL